MAAAQGADHSHSDPRKPSTFPSEASQRAGHSSLPARSSPRSEKTLATYRSRDRAVILEPLPIRCERWIRSALEQFTAFGDVGFHKDDEIGTTETDRQSVRERRARWEGDGRERNSLNRAATRAARSAGVGSDHAKKKTMGAGPRSRLHTY